MKSSIDNHDVNYALQKPLYSIVIATFNRAEFLEQCLTSLTVQNPDLSYEVLVVDDGSTDATPQISRNFANRYPQRFKAIRQEHKELAAAKNLGIRSSVGDVVVFLDDDAVAPIDFLEKIHSVLTSKNADVLGFIDLPMEKDSYLAKGVRYLENFSRRFLVRDVRLRLKGHIAVKRTILERSGLFDESRGYRRAEDTDMNYRLAIVTSKIVFSDVVYVYHRTPTFTRYVTRSFSKLASSRMLDVPNAFQYYRIDFGLTVLIALLLVASSNSWYLFEWFFSVALVGLIAFSFGVSAASSRTLRFGPAILLISSVRILFLALFSVRFVAEQMKRLI
jgi:glycosyltransferase involved in cell wall biosynthesis